MVLSLFRRRVVAHQAGAPVVRFSHVSARYDGGEPALQDVSFELAAGERVAIVGPNGAGKSTLFKVLAGIMPISAGSIEVFGHQAGGHVCIGYVPQRVEVDWNFPVTVADVVMMGRVARIGVMHNPGKQDWRLVDESLGQVGLRALAERQIGELSGGQQQRAFIARALAQEADLLLMDEPLTGLDTPSQEGIFEILELLRAHGMTVLISTHDLHLAADRFDRLMLLRRRLLGLGHASEVLTPANLSLAYGPGMAVIAAPDGVLVVEDTCCEGPEGHVHG